jgi:ketosteroid isomerase-like protein
MSDIAIPHDIVVWNAPSLADHPARRASILSPTMAGLKDKDGWLALYADDAVVEDPVGPSIFDAEGAGHRGKAALSAFWDLTIGPLAAFRIRIEDSFANGDSCANVGTITTTFPDGTVVDTDLVMVYVVGEDGLIRSLRAHWEFDRSVATARKE